MFAALKSLPKYVDLVLLIQKKWYINIWTAAKVKSFTDVDLLYIIVKLNLFGTDFGQRQFIRRDFWEGIT